MIDLSRYLRRESFVRLKAGGRDDLLRELLRRCLPDEPEGGREAVVGELLHSEAMKDQVIGGGFAITHTRRDVQDEIRLAVGLLDPPRPLRRGPAVHTVFCAVIPVDKSRDYLGFMARLSRLLADPAAEQAFRSGDMEAILERVAAFSG